MLRASIGSTPSALQIIDDTTYKEGLKNFIKHISDLQYENGVTWVFVFDQINGLFVKPGCEGKNAFGALPFPYNMVEAVTDPGRITSIISASANNELAYKESPKGFEDCDHPTSLSEEELRVLYKEQLNGLDLGDFHYLTGFVPLYVNRYLNMEESRFINEIYGEVEAALEKLETQYGDTSVGKNSWKMAGNVIISLLLGTEPKSKRHYDRKFSCFNERGIPTALFPLVQSAYRQIFWARAD